MAGRRCGDLQPVRRCGSQADEICRFKRRRRPQGVSEGHEVEATWKALEAFQPEFALIDVGMPKLNGLQAAAMTRAAPWAQSTTLVALTGRGQEGDRQAALAAGFHYHFVKPVDVDSLLRVLLSTPPSSPAWN
jgi:CheY-like chemotaxis protein